MSTKRLVGALRVTTLVTMAILASAAMVYSVMDSPIPPGVVQMPRVKMFHNVCISTLQRDGTVVQNGLPVTVGPADTTNTTPEQMTSSLMGAFALKGIPVNKISLVAASGGRITPNGKPILRDPPPGEASCVCTNTIKDSEGKIIGCGGLCGNCYYCVVKP